MKKEDASTKEKIIITGAIDGLGKSIAYELIKKGNKVSTCARTKEKIDLAKKQKVFTSAYQLDLADRYAASQFVYDSIEDLGGLNVLILNAAVTGIREDPKYVFKVNEVAQVALTKASADELRANKGRVVFLSSASKYIEGVEKYGETKRRMEEWLKEFANRPENKNIQIFSVIPGACDTKMHQEVISYGHGEVKARTEKILKEGGLRNPETVGKIISEMSVTGRKFNPATYKYDLPISQCEVITITDENIKTEEKKLWFVKVQNKYIINHTLEKNLMVEVA